MDEWELKGIILSEVENRKIASLTPCFIKIAGLTPFLNVFPAL